MIDDELRNLPPDMKRTEHVLVTGICGVARVDKLMGYLLENGFDDIQWSYPKNEAGQIIEKRLISVSATKITSITKEWAMEWQKHDS